MKTKVSFIIPALNEERRIAALIDNIKILGNWCNYEIIVSDGHSTDKTADIAEKKGAMVIKDDPNAPKTIANGRNTGARLATGEIYIFCDADTVIKDPCSLLSDIFKVFRDREIIGAAPSLNIFPDETLFKDRVFHFLFNKIVRFSFATKVPICGGQCQIVRASSFREVDGYNVNIVHGEDSDFFRRLRKIGKLHFFTQQVIYESPRRYRRFGYFLLLIQGIHSLVYQQIFKKNLFKEWRRIDKEINNKRKSVFII
jgi:glycosyltransferase involved in cell wall biosynthesis